MGEGAFAVFTGDQKQNDLKGASGLEQTISLMEDMIVDQPEYLLDEDLEEMSKHIGFIRFTPEDVVRSGLTRALVKVYYNN